MSSSFMTPWTVVTRFLSPWDFPGKGTGVGCHFLLQGIFPTQGSNLGLLLRQVDSLPLSHQRSPFNEYFCLEFLPFKPLTFPFIMWLMGLDTSLLVWGVGRGRGWGHFSSLTSFSLPVNLGPSFSQGVSGRPRSLL